MRTKTLWIRDKYLSWILQGSKTIEVRVAYSNIARLETGDRLMLNDRHPYKIRRVGRYTSFEELLAHEDPKAIAPNLKPDDLLAALRELYPAEKEALGVIALEISPLVSETNP
jgi:ASC-1-like (ASCH) protein